MPRNTNAFVRLFTFVCFFTLTAVLIVLPAFSQDDPESSTPNAKLGALGALAEYVPGDSLAFFALRTDQAYIETLDALIASALDALPPDTLPAHPSLSQLLDAGTASLFLVDFVNGVRPWLGDAAGVSVGALDLLIDETRSNDGFIPFTMYAQITDRAAAEAFADAFIAQYYGEISEWSRDAQADYTLYAPVGSFPNVAILVRDDLIAVSTSAKWLPTDGTYDYSLNDNPQFNHIVELLPADSYNIVGYADVPTLLSYAYSTPYMFNTGSDRLLMSALLRTIGPMGGGATIIEEGDGAAQVLVLDAVMAAGNYTGLEAFGLVLGDPQATDPAFIVNLPSDAALALHGSNLANSIDLLTENYTALEPIIYPALFGVVANSMYSSSSSAAILGGYNVFARYVTQIPGIISGNLLGLDYDTEVRNWLSGDYALFFRANTDVNPLAYTAALAAVDFAFVSEAGDAALSRQAIATLQRDLPITLRTIGARNVAFAQETIGTADALTITINMLPSYMRDTFQVDPTDGGFYTFVVAADDTRFAFGTRRAVTDIFAIDPLLRATAPAFAITQDTLLETNNTVYYASGPQLTRFIDAMKRVMGGGDPSYLSQMEIVRAVLLWLGEGTISTSTNENRDVIARAALSISSPGVLEALRPQFAALPVPERSEPLFLPTPVTLPTAVMAFPTPTAILLPEATEEVADTSLFANYIKTRTVEGGFVLGDPDAPVTIVVFFDYYCPHCQEYHDSTLIPLIASYIAEGQAKLETRFLVTAGGARMTQMAGYAECIDEQSPGVYWDFSEVAFAAARAGSLSPATAIEFAARNGLDVNVLEECVIDANQTDTDLALARELGASSTPAVFVRYGDAFPQPLPAGREFSDLVSVIAAVQE